MIVYAIIINNFRLINKSTGVQNILYFFCLPAEGDFVDKQTQRLRAYCLSVSLAVSVALTFVFYVMLS